MHPLSGSLWRLLSLTGLGTAAIWWVACGVARAATPPSNSQLPTISGTAVQGRVLNASTGTWTGDTPMTFSYLWSDGQTGSTDTLSASDVGQSVSVTVTAVNAAGRASATSASVGPVLPAAPVNTSAPGISGTAQQGDTLTVNNGTWKNNPASFSYVWEDCKSPGAGCSAIGGATFTGYVLQASDVGEYVSVKVTASNAGGQSSVTTASVGPVLPPAPVNTTAPVITGTPEQGNTLSVSSGTWSNGPTGFSYAWERCSSSGSNCSAIDGATATSYALSAADVGSTIMCVVTAKGPGGPTSVATSTTAVVAAAPVPAASQATTTSLLASPTALVTNQSVTLIATVSAGASSTALWGTVTIENAGSAIPGCMGMPAIPSGVSATVACSTSFAASSAQITAAFTPTTGSILQGSVSPPGDLTVRPDSSSTSLAAPTTVNVAASVTYSATVAPPAARPGPVEPTGTVEFLDAGQAIGSCMSRPLAGGAATCSLSYAIAGVHQITARYSGDANFSGSSSPADAVSAVRVPATVAGSITSTMQWSFYYTPSYTLVRNLVVNGAVSGETVVANCRGRGCPYTSHATVLAKAVRCGRGTKGTCLTAGSLNLTPAFAGRRLGFGARITISIVRPNWIGKAYRFTVRSRRGPRVQIGCLAPGASTPGVGC